MPLGVESTTFTFDTQGRYLGNTLDETLHSAGIPVGLGTPPPDARPFDVIVVGGGSFGVLLGQHLLATDDTFSRRVLVLERGRYVIPEHEQNLPYTGGVTPGFREVWVSDLDTGGAGSVNRHGGFAGLQLAVGGRSLNWGGWSPELLPDETQDWPVAADADLRNTYFEQAADQLGTSDTNDFLYGPLHTALRARLRAGATGLANTLPSAEWPDHPAVRYKEPAATDGRLRGLLGLDPADTTPRQQLLDLLKLEAPLAVQSRTEPGLFPINKFSSVPILIRVVRFDVGASAGYDEFRRLIVVPNVQVLDVVTTPPGPVVTVTGVRVASPAGDRFVPLAPNGVVVVAMGTIESTRLAKLTFRASLAGAAADRIGTNLMAHLRSNLTVRVPLASLGLVTADLAGQPVPVSALFVKGRATVAGRRRYFHLQVTASGGPSGGTDSEALLFKKVPDLDFLQTMKQATSTHVVVTLRGIGEMVPGNPSSKVDLSAFDTDGGRQAAWVTLGNAKEYAKDPAAPATNYQTTPVSEQTKQDATTWEAMDDWTDAVAVALANGQEFEVLTGAGATKLPAGATAADLKAAHPHDARRDKLGTTHHEAGTMRMGTAADAVTDDLGRLHGTPNCYFAGPCLFPTIGSPNPMLTGTALARRTADYLAGRLPPARSEAPPLGQPAPPPADGSGWQVLFDGTASSFRQWRRVGSTNGGNDRFGVGRPPCDLRLIDGQIATLGNGDHALLYYQPAGFSNFVLRVQFRIVDAGFHNGGVIVRARRPDLDLPPTLAQRADALGRPWRTNRAWTAVFSGFEVQIDDNAKPDGLRRHRTGAVYDIPAGDPGEATEQSYTPAPALSPATWYEFEITVQQNNYEVKLGRADGSPKATVSVFTNTDGVRGLPNSVDPNSGFVGLQAHNDGRVYYRHVRIKPL
jgi:choline dehydrogenase-like flavoprotein